MRRRSRGFTLIELMMVVAIIGLLSSIAIPSFRNMQLRSRQAERSMMLTAINRSIADFYARDQRYPLDLGGGLSLLNLNANPDPNPGPQKRAFRTAGFAADNWRNLSLFVEGNVYYSYSGSGQVVLPTRWHVLSAVGDLDGNGAQDTVQKWWIYTADLLQKNPGWHGLDCSLEQRIPAAMNEF